MISYVLASIIALAMLAADQLTKIYISSNMELFESHGFIKGLIDITYIHNDGGAWGMLGGYTWILLSMTILIMLICVTMLIKVGFKNKLMFWSICFILSGGLGNMIDRFMRDGKVVDFLQFSFWKSFPIFNVADICVVVGAGMLILYFVLDIIKENQAKKNISDNNEKEGENEQV